MTDDMKIGFTGRIRVEPMEMATLLAYTGRDPSLGYSSDPYGNKPGSRRGSRSAPVMHAEFGLGLYLDVYA